MSLQHGGVARSWKPGPRAKAAIGRALDLIFPPQTLDTQTLDRAAPPQSGGLSASAWSKIQFIAEPLCDGCGAPFEYDLGGRCAACQARPRGFGRARAACLYDEASRDLILQFKHADRTDLTRLFVDWISRAAPDLLAEADVVAPVPLHPWRLLGRRYNQAAELAGPLARRHGLAYWPDVLTRSRATESQGGKSASGRRRNVAGAFAVRPSKAGRVEGKRIVLIDDVLTTGATAEGCARALRRAGAEAVDIAVVARVRERADIAI